MDFQRGEAQEYSSGGRAPSSRTPGFIQCFPFGAPEMWFEGVDQLFTRAGIISSSRSGERERLDAPDGRASGVSDVPVD